MGSVTAVSLSDMAAAAAADDSARRSELAQFLRSRREALRPEDVGLPAIGTRRVAGLRRNEVADLAAVSVTWYTWLEQGRVTRTTTSVLESLCRALRLDDASRRHLFRLAGAPVPELGGEPDVDPGLVAWVRDQQFPACISDRSTDFVAWNHAYTRILGDPADLPPERRNALVVMLTSELFRRVEGWERIAADRVAVFRALAAERPDDARARGLIALLESESDIFRRTWRSHEVLRFEPTVFVFHDPNVGEIRLREVLLRPFDRQDLLLAVLHPVDAASREHLSALVAAD
jgi:hypothetical protein